MYMGFLRAACHLETMRLRLQDYTLKGKKTSGEAYIT